ncbi:hypothetical protein B0T16DRAFT_55748 [Cercophora newfieldiana]|uniref:Uncharacterized protein n=1 Tax=Cercophora newfieldiana TaxID=92897 RepID=A0AA39YSM4_9PEZI|nr:hypothetical protein B0T16DRAFT_55748 [Cercophora newfieldiana]
MTMLEVLTPPGDRTWPTVIHRGSNYASTGINGAPNPVPKSLDCSNEIAPKEKETAPGQQRTNLLDLPLEIRLQIYSWVHLSHPMQQPELCPWYPTPKHSAYFLASIMTPVFWRDDDDDENKTATYLTNETIRSPNQSSLEPSQQRQQQELLSPYRLQSYIPTSLLSSCRQVYFESRAIPFYDNEFVFVTWFSSGLSAARAFVKGLRPWQRNAMRHARIEMQIRDLGDGARLAVWEELCGYWREGMRGLRVKVDVEDRDVVWDWEGKGEEKGPWWMLSRGWASRTWTGKPWRWVDVGLRRLSGLRVVEVEIVGREMEDWERVQWCAALKRRVNEASEQEVKVVCVRRAGGKRRREKR